MSLVFTGEVPDSGAVGWEHLAASLQATINAKAGIQTPAAMNQLYRQGATGLVPAGVSDDGSKLISSRGRLIFDANPGSLSSDVVSIGRGTVGNALTSNVPSGGAYYWYVGASSSGGMLLFSGNLAIGTGGGAAAARVESRNSAAAQFRGSYDSLKWVELRADSNGSGRWKSSDNGQYPVGIQNAAGINIGGLFSDANGRGTIYLFNESASQLVYLGNLSGSAYMTFRDPSVTGDTVRVGGSSQPYVNLMYRGAGTIDARFNIYDQDTLAGWLAFNGSTVFQMRNYKTNGSIYMIVDGTGSFLVRDTAGNSYALFGSSQTDLHGNLTFPAAKASPASTVRGIFLGNTTNQLRLNVPSGGFVCLDVAGNSLVRASAAALSFFGMTPAARDAGWSLANWTPTRTLDASTADLATLRNIVATLINAHLTNGYLGS
ncbi:MAG: hypothetical protein AB7S38_29070 [Vulcanimicrobiota bacterium]